MANPPELCPCPFAAQLLVARDLAENHPELYDEHADSQATHLGAIALTSEALVRMKERYGCPREEQESKDVTCPLQQYVLGARQMVAGAWKRDDFPVKLSVLTETRAAPPKRPTGFASA